MEKAVNRILQAWKSWEEKQKEMEKAVGTGTEHTAVLHRLKLEHFQKCRNLLAGNIRKDEQPFLPLMNAAISKLERQLRPNLMARLFYRLKNVLVDAPKQVRAHELQRQENMEALKGQLFKAGFSDFAGRLENQLDAGNQKHAIPLSSQLDQHRSLNVSLYFEKDTEDRFHFTMAGAIIKHNDGKSPDRSFQFKMDEWPGLKAQEMKNLLDGRAVKQEFTDITGRSNSQWLELPANGTTARRYTESYGYELRKVLEQPQFSAVAIPGGRPAMAEKLEQGHRVAARWSHAGSYETIFMQADPATSGIKLTDSANKTLTSEQLNQKLESRQEKQQAVVKQLAQAPKITLGKKRSRSIGS